MKPRIYLAFVDDWELRGDGSGDIERRQFRPMRELVKIFDANGIRGSFNAEVMQQLTFRKFQTLHPELKQLADDWDVVVRETFKHGHDIQLHVHPQWRDAVRVDGGWKLNADWSILNHEPQAALEMMTACKQYLENLLRPLDPNYRCLSFRSGSWCIAPSPHILSLLVKLGIVFDMSIVSGVSYNTRHVQLDYRNCEETFLPYYPLMTDARRISDKAEQIICVPTNHFYESRTHLFRKHLGKLKRKIKAPAPVASTKKSLEQDAQNYYQEWAETGDASRPRRIFNNVLAPYLKGKHFISDIAQLDYSLLGEMLKSIRQRAQATGLPEVPVILENHTKDIQDFSHIERFIKDVAHAPDIKCLTLTELAAELQNGRFQIKTKAAAPR